MFLKFYFVLVTLISEFTIHKLVLAAEPDPLKLSSASAPSAPPAPGVSVPYYAQEPSYTHDAHNPQTVNEEQFWPNAQTQDFQSSSQAQTYQQSAQDTIMYPALDDTSRMQSELYPEFSHTSSYSSEPPIMAAPLYPPIAYQLPYVRDARPQLQPTASFVPLSHSPEKNSAEYELGISAFKLHKKDFFSKSDPICILLVPEYRNMLNIKWKEYGRTKPLKNTHEPKFTDKFNIRYYFDTLQPLRFEFYDVDGSRLGQLLGFVEMELGDLTLREYTEKNLQKVKRNKIVNLDSFIVVRTEELSENKDQVTIQFMGQHLPYVKLLAAFSRNLYIEIYKVDESGRHIPVHRTETVTWSFKTLWKPLTVEIRKLNNGDNNMNLRFVLYSENNCSPDTELGRFHSTITELNQKRTFFLTKENEKPGTDGKHKKRKKEKTYGEIHVVQFNYIEIPTFTKFLRGGLQFNAVISIDFTKSNWAPNLPYSLHFWGPEMNQYEIAIYETISILSIYDYDKKFPTIGFGAKIPPDFDVPEHAFNIHEFGYDCDGLWDILVQYRKCLQRITFFQPTFFAPSIEYAVRQFDSGKLQDDGNTYLVLQILTDGKILDPDPTKRALVKASYYPISIIIVGIGQEVNEHEMRILDADKDAFVIDGQSCRHDITQFVSFEQVKRDSSALTAPQLLAQRLLEEVPRQLISHMIWRGFRPRPPSTEIFTLPPDPASL